MAGRAGKYTGRKKIEITKISNETNLNVTFSKRRSGLFKKASELCTLSGAEVAVIIFSPGNKVFSFGHPSVQSVAERYLEEAAPPNAATQPSMGRVLQFVEAYQGASVETLNLQLNYLLGELEVEKRRGEELSRLRKEGQGGGRWWEAPIRELGLEELDRLKEAMEDLRKNVSVQEEILKLVEEAAERAAAGPFAPPPHANATAAGFGAQVCATPHGNALGFGRSFF